MVVWRHCHRSVRHDVIVLWRQKAIRTDGAPPVEQYRHNTPAHSSSYLSTSKQTTALILLTDGEIVMFVNLKRVVATDKDIITLHGTHPAAQPFNNPRGVHRQIFFDSFHWGEGIVRYNMSLEQQTLSYEQRKNYWAAHYKARFCCRLGNQNNLRWKHILRVCLPNLSDDLLMEFEIITTLQEVD